MHVQPVLAQDIDRLRHGGDGVVDRHRGARLVVLQALGLCRARLALQGDDLLGGQLAGRADLRLLQGKRLGREAKAQQEAGRTDRRVEHPPGRDMAAYRNDGRGLGIVEVDRLDGGAQREADGGRRPFPGGGRSRSVVDRDTVPAARIVEARDPHVRRRGWGERGRGRIEREGGARGRLERRREEGAHLGQKVGERRRDRRREQNRLGPAGPRLDVGPERRGARSDGVDRRSDDPDGGVRVQPNAQVGDGAERREVQGGEDVQVGGRVLVVEILEPAGVFGLKRGRHDARTGIRGADRHGGVLQEIGVVAGRPLPCHAFEDLVRRHPPGDMPRERPRPHRPRVHLGGC